MPENKLQRYARGVFQTKTAQEGTEQAAEAMVAKMSPEQAQAVADFGGKHQLTANQAWVRDLARAKLSQKFDRQTSARNQWSDPEIRAKMIAGMKVKTKVMARKAKAEALAAKQSA